MYSLQLRKFNLSDVQSVEGIYKKFHFGKFSVPRLDKTIYAGVVEEDNKIIGYGALENIVQATMILDLGARTKSKHEVLTKLVDAAKIVSLINGYDSVYVTPSDDKFKEILIKHFNFQEVEFLRAENG